MSRMKREALRELNPSGNIFNGSLERQHLQERYPLVKVLTILSLYRLKEFCGFISQSPKEVFYHNKNFYHNKLVSIIKVHYRLVFLFISNSCTYFGGTYDILIPTDNV